MFAQQLRATGAENGSEHQGNDDRIVGDRDEVGNEVERKGEIADHGGERELASSPTAIVAEQAPEERDGVRHESRPGRERPGGDQRL